MVKVIRVIPTTVLKMRMVQTQKVRYSRGLKVSVGDVLKKAMETKATS